MRLIKEFVYLVIDGHTLNAFFLLFIHEEQTNKKKETSTFVTVLSEHCSWHNQGQRGKRTRRHSINERKNKPQLSK